MVGEDKDWKSFRHKNGMLATEWIKLEWIKGDLSASEMGRELGISKNSLLGKAHRLGLPSRPSPIKRGPRQSRKNRNNGVPRVGKLSVVTLGQNVPLIDGRTAPRVFIDPRPKFNPNPVPVVIPVLLISKRESGARQCEWMDGDRPNYKQCEGEAVGRKPYCTEHNKLAFVNKRDQQAA